MQSFVRASGFMKPSINTLFVDESCTTQGTSPFDFSKFTLVGSIIGLDSDGGTGTFKV